MRMTAPATGQPDDSKWSTSSPTRCNTADSSSSAERILGRIRRVARSVAGSGSRLIADRHLDAPLPASLHEREADLALAAVSGDRAADHINRLRQLVAPLRRELRQGGQQLGTLCQFFGVRRMPQQEFSYRRVHP